MAGRAKPARIYVLAGTNGAGKSSIGGAMFSQSGVGYFNPDEAAERIRTAVPNITVEESNSRAWHEGRRLLERAIAGRLDFAFETTLGGNTITALLQSAAASGIEVRIWYAGLSSPELHIARVRARVARGGHDVPEGRIRERYDRSRRNLITLLPGLAELRLYDNSREADPERGRVPQPRLLMHWRRGKLVRVPGLRSIPAWAKPIVMAAMKLSAR